MLKVYSITTCPWCEKVKKYLKTQSIGYEEHNIEENDTDAQECLKISGDTMVPVVTADNTNYVVGFDKAKLDTLLKNYAVNRAKDLIAAPSCYAGLKEKAQNWISSVGTDQEAQAAKEMIDEISADITGIDGLVAFSTSEHAKEIFGEEGAKNFAKHAHELKESGAKYCDCQACSAGLDLLNYKDFLIKG